MKLISDMFDSSATVLTEQNDAGKKEVFIQGVFMQSDIQNRNKRVYPRKILEGQLNEYKTNFVEKARALGELGHPEGPTVNLERVSHNIVEMSYTSNTDVRGKAKLLDTPYGNLAKGLVSDGVTLGVSTRGLGSLVESEGVNVVQPDFHLAAVDIVADPSAPDAFVNGIMESVEWVYVNGVLTEQQIEDVKKKVDAVAASTRRTDEEVIKIFESILIGNCA